MGPSHVALPLNYLGPKGPWLQGVTEDLCFPRIPAHIALDCPNDPTAKATPLEEGKVFHR